MPNTQFGSGVFFGSPNAGNLAPNPTPMSLSVLQDITLSIKGDLKKLYGMFQAPVAKARGKIDVSLKGKVGSLDPQFYSQLYFGTATTTGMLRPVFNEPAVAAASVTPANSTASANKGVINVSTGKTMTCSGTTAPAAGQYKFIPATTTPTVTAAEYVFNATDIANNLAVLLSYEWPDLVNGTTLHVGQELMGYAPEFEGLLYNNFRNSCFGVRLYSCVMGQLSIPTKQEDFWISDFDAEASTDVSGNLLDIFSD
jgi:hypothetical protein